MCDNRVKGRKAPANPLAASPRTGTSLASATRRGGVRTRRPGAPSLLNPAGKAQVDTAQQISTPPAGSGNYETEKQCYAMTTDQCEIACPFHGFV